MRKPFIAGNWKMNKDTGETSALAKELSGRIGSFDKADILICPPFTSLAAAGEALEGSLIKLGAQNMHWEEKGAFTGEVSAPMVKSAGCSYVIVGHSERRKYFSESNQEINKKIKAALAAGLYPVFCIGETLEEREQGKTKDVVQKQLREGLVSLSGQDLEKVTVAYEPVWAIGTGKTATGSQAEDVHAFIRKWIEDNFSLSLSQNLRILYGGSVKPGNIKELIGKENIDGALVGGASLEAESFSQIVEGSV